MSRVMKTVLKWLSVPIAAVALLSPPGPTKSAQACPS